ncbi:MAG: extracellular solute-binding protein [Cellulomonadaceae bacterium]|jgi:multiple sugar transport system substrate-binding protein|nr:extracellular solute-binding protein [Cellulomonadaceae bacterium]
MMKRTSRVLAAGAAAALLFGLTACGGGGGFGETGNGGGDNADTSSPAAGDGSITVLIGSSGDAETNFVQSAVDEWSQESGNTGSLQLASDLPQQLAQGFAAGSPPDVFYVSTDAFAGWAENGSLWAYGDQLGDFDYHQSLVDTFTYDGTFYCAPKDFSTLALVINTDLWEKAGLTDADLPTDWDSLKATAEKLTADGVVGLSFGPEWQRVGTFMAQAGGGLMNDAGQAIVDDPANVTALTYVKELLASGFAAYPADIGAGWGGEAIGAGKAAMVIEGNWVIGALANDFPDVNYKIAALPEGPGGPGTLQFTNCWGIAADSPNQEAALDFVKFMSSDEQQMANARALGVMPAVTTVKDQWSSEFPAQAPFIDGADNAQGFPALAGVQAVITEFNNQLVGLKDADLNQMLGTLQGDLEAIVP